MLELIESLSLASGAVVVAVLSALTTLVCGVLWPARLWLAVVLAPLVLTLGIYWYPVLRGAAPVLEYVAWAIALVIPWLVAGLMASGLTAILLRLWRRMAHSRDRDTGPTSR